jgi:imidazole glycerol phosphate synthase glutamine amidotransferase subunit
MLEGCTPEDSIAVNERTVVISVFDYGAGNLRSVQNTLGAIGAEYELIRDASGIERATKLVLPGVGHFGQMMRALDDLQVRNALIEHIRAGVPFLGICLGLQALFETSEEALNQRGLGIYPGEVKRFHGDLRIPHMGWNQVQPCRPNTLLASVEYLYFAHSYYCPVVPETAAVCDYVVPYTAILEQANVRGVQFHPEKSGPAGLQIVKNFVDAG